MTITPKTATRLLYLGLLAFIALLVLAITAIAKDWQRQVATSRARAAYEMVHTAVPNRPSDTPGAMAWLHWELRRYLGDDLADSGFPVTLVDWAQAEDLPLPVRDLGDLLTGLTPTGPQPLPRVTNFGEEDTSELQFRTQFYLQAEDAQLVVTRRRSIAEGVAEDPNHPANRFLARAAVQLRDLHQQMEALPALEEGPYKIVRLFALCEDGTLITLPRVAAEMEAAERMRMLREEGQELRKLPKLPTLVSNEFFFIFDFKDSQTAPFYSGIYLDLAGHGLIASLTTPLPSRDDALRGIVGVDLAFAMDWQRFAEGIAPPLVATIVPPLPYPHPGHWRPWADIERVLSDSVDADLRDAVAHLARHPPPKAKPLNPSSVYHGVVPDQGAVVAFPVSRENWMVLLFPQQPPTFPTLSLVSAGLLFLVLLIGFEWNRRRAEASQRKAVAEFREKQNLLESMQVPLMVVDPNTEEVVYSNRASRDLGVVEGRAFREWVADEPAAMAHYERMQRPDPSARRAYGLPLNVNGRRQYAVIRSVAVRAPIDMIKADERHRLGILFLIEPEADLGLFAAELTARTRHDERRKLAGLLSHGVDTLAKVLQRILAREQTNAEEREFAAWLSAYIQRRLRVTAWVLDHWLDTTPAEPSQAIGPSEAQATLAQWQRLFGIVAQDATLRSWLRWNNGVLAKRANADEPVFQYHLNWPESFALLLPLRGGFGFFLGEILVNAMRHGVPGTTPNLTIRADPVRAELQFEVTNAVNPSTGNDMRDLRDYGGRGILEKLAQLFGWHHLTFKVGDGKFQVSWHAPIIERTADGDSD